jgi:hypothetical protein
MDETKRQQMTGRVDGPRERLERAMRRHGVPVQVDLQEWMEPKKYSDQPEH